MIAIKLKAKPKRYKEDAASLTILLLLTFFLGIYLIATTVLITQDGVYYIKRAQKLSSDPKSVIISNPPGYPFLIFIAHKFISLFNSNQSAQTWAYTAQSVTLLCRLFAIIPLYFIGKLFVGPRNSFWALLILILLPYPARFGSDVLRDWPHILFLAAGFLFLLWGIEQGKWWFLGMTGLLAGLGSTIRPECVQLMVYSILWLLIRLLKSKSKMNRVTLLCSLFILLTGFAFPIVPYVRGGGRIYPTKLRKVVDSSKKYVVSFSRTQSEKDVKIDSQNRAYKIKSLFNNTIKAIGRLIGEISENLMYFYLPPLLVGIYYRFRKKSMITAIERFFVPSFIVLNVIMMILLCCSQGYISRRHCLPLVIFSIFYVPIGLQIFAECLSSRFSKGCFENDSKPRLSFFVLMAIGITICLPKLVRPLRIEKRGYKDVAKWLKENTDKEDLIAVPDHRIGFYAEREVFEGEIKGINKRIKYIVKTIGADNEGLDIPKDIQVQEVYSVWLDQRERIRKLVIFKTM